MKLPGTALTLCLFLVSPAYAQTESYSEEYEQCTERGSSESELRICTDAEFERQDGLLNAAYREAINTLTGKERQKLLESQRLWIRMRDATCEVMALQYEGGTIQPRIALQCLVNQTIRRTRDLKEMLEV